MPALPSPAVDPGFDHLYIFGAGGLGREVAWLAMRSWGNRVGLTFVVDQARYMTPPIHGLAVRLLTDVHPDGGGRFIVAVGDPATRRSLAAAAEARGLRPGVLVHPGVEVPPSASVGEGSIVNVGTTITVDVRIGRHVLVNPQCSLAHDVTIGDFAALSPGVHVAGNVTVEAGVFLGTGAVILPGSQSARLTIGAGAVVAAGACVTRSVEPGAMVAGVPAVRKR